ncbi:MAG: alpha/beta hydrolase [Clostridia bacterium]|nr:alpha/beta hydrolase [Clostridia bacterium]
MVALIIIPALIVLFFIFLYILYYRTFHNSPRRHKKYSYNLNASDEHKAKLKQIRDDLRGAECERIYIKNRKGKRLAARYYHIREGAPVAIVLHGYKGRALSDPAGGFEILRNMGINVLIPDHRAHGESHGRTITFGIKERLDCVDWVRYLNDRFSPTAIFLMGVSMGAATALMASGEQLPSNVKGVIADCGFSSPEKIIRKVIGVDMKLPQRLLFPFVRLAGMVYGRFDICSYDAVKAVSRTNLPVLIIHGEADDFVPCEMAYEICRAGKCQLLTVPRATHGMSYIFDTKGYTDTVTAFINSII